MAEFAAALRNLKSGALLFLLTFFLLPCNHQIIRHQPASLLTPPTPAACQAPLQPITTILFPSPTLDPLGLQTTEIGESQTAGKQISQASAGFPGFREASWCCLFCHGFATFLWTFLSPVLAMGGFGLDYLPATSSSSESSWHQSSAPSGTWAAQGPPAMEDSSAVLMESLKVCLTDTVLRNWVLVYGARRSGDER